MAPDVFSLASYFMGGILNLIIMVLTIAFIVKLVMALVSMGKNVAGGNWPWSKKGGDDDRDRPDRSTKEKDEADKSKFEQGIENPGFLKIRVRNEDDEPVQDVKITVFPNWRKRKISYGPHPTNKDGMFPNIGGEAEELTLPSGVTIKVKWVYWLPFEDNYKSQQRSKWLLGARKKRHFAGVDRVILAKDEHKVHLIQIPFRGEVAYGFEPYINKVDTSQGRIRTEFIVRSSTGRR